MGHTHFATHSYQCELVSFGLHHQTSSWFSLNNMNFVYNIFHKGTYMDLLCEMKIATWFLVGLYYVFKETIILR